MKKDEKTDSSMRDKASSNYGLITVNIKKQNMAWSLRWKRFKIIIHIY